jgi:hypothetical protein
MTVRKWQMVKTRYCNTAESNVALEAEVAYPPDFMPDGPARVFSHRCSHGAQCMVFQRGVCKWSGGNPSYDPFVEKE